ncbi:MAG TPA: phospholipase D-like domain-containing protein [Candidatus Paceibacterota bacterium]|nr:phospholipase D-like domain-containing protein [Candidatus Paceibacterota bacterium]
MGEHHETKIREVLINGLENAKQSIRLAVAYFNDLEIANIIKKKAEEGIATEVIIYDHFVNSPAIIELNSNNIKTFFYRVYETQPIYPKFCLIDGDILVTGNHGWAYAANRTEHPEPLIVNNENILIEEYINKFYSLKKNCGASKLVHFRIKPESPKF